MRPNTCMKELPYTLSDEDLLLLGKLISSISAETEDEKQIDMNL